MIRYSMSFRPASPTDQPCLAVYYHFRKLLLVAIFATVNPLALQAQDESPCIANPPRILLAARITDDDQLELVTYQTIYIGFDGSSYNHRSFEKISLRDVRITKLDGTELTIHISQTAARVERATRSNSAIAIDQSKGGYFAARLACFCQTLACSLNKLQPL
ncbi:MAG: hypothetical protein R3C28_27315 [Pirellulaceae bacterium]